MSSKAKTMVGALGVILGLALGFFVYGWASDGSIRKATSLQEQLYAAADLPPAEFNALKLQLMRTVDEMPREKVRDLYEELEVRGKEDHRSNLDRFFATTTDTEREIVMDEIIDRWQKSKEIQRAMWSDGARPRRRRGNRGDRGKKNGEGEKVEPTEEEKAARKEEQRRNQEYFEALKERAEFRGLD